MIIDSITRNKVTLAKLTFHQGFELSSATTGTSQRVLAVVAYDWAIETTLKAAVMQADTTVSPMDLSNNLIKTCTKKLLDKGIAFSNQGHATQVRDIRNAAQHQARVPTNDELIECRIRTHDFLTTFVKEIWNLDFASLSVADFVQHTQVRGLLYQADERFVIGEYREAAAHAWCAVQLAVEKATRAIVGEEMDHFPLNAPGFRLDENTRIALEQINTQVKRQNQALQRIRTTVLYSALGIDYATYVRLGSMIGEAWLMVAGNVHLVMTNRSQTIDRDTASHMIAVYAEMAAQVESKVGDLEAPFGYEHWF